jgi:glutamyl-tRNA reductase
MLTLVGVSHRTASLDVRDRLTFRPAEAVRALELLRDRHGVREGVMLSTCNRTEVYVVEGEADAVPAVWAQLSERLGQDASAFGYVRRDREAATHLFRVASGLDSLVLGEAQIHGQVRDAWEACRAQSSAVLNRLFQTSLLVAGRVRSETVVGHGAASVSSAAVQLAKQIFGSLRGIRAMVFGAGEMADLALECLAAEGVQASVVANRTYDRAVELAARHGGRAMTLDDAWTELAQVDLLLSSTAAPQPIVTADRVRPALARRGDRPLCVLDIAVPRDVEPAVGRLDNVFLYDLDDLQRVVSANIERRKAELPRAEALIADEVERFWQWIAGLEAVPVLTEFRARMEAVRDAEVADALRRMPDLTAEQRAAVERLARSLTNKFMHEPSVRLRAAAANGRGLGIVDAVRYLFALDQGAGRTAGAAAPGAGRGEPPTDDRG